MERKAYEEKVVKIPEQEKSIWQMHSRQEVAEVLKKLYERGYRYVVRDKDMPYLVSFSLKPKRYRDTESWGYVNPDETGVIMAYPFKNVDITEINYSNRSATLIETYLTKM